MSILKIKDSQGNWVGVPTVKGDTGNGISSAVLNNDYTLTLTFTDGTTYTTPSIRGEKGEQGEPATDMDIHICSASEYDSETRIPTIANPNDKTFYLVPTEDGTSPDLFTEWVYLNGAWEMFGSMKIDLSGYVKDTDYATDAKAGVIKLNPYYGINVTDDGILYVNTAESKNAKMGTNNARPITPIIQHESTFYALAKVAGHDEKNSELPVGQYTDEAKSSIQDMLDVPSTSELKEVNDSKADVIVESASGDIVSFDDGADDMPLKSLVVDINPVQDLNGYDSPWVGGGGKNLFHNTAVTTTVNGITFTVNSDGSVTANGTATANAVLISPINELTDGETYILNGCPSGGSSTTHEIMIIQRVGTQAVVNQYGDDKSFVYDSEKHKFIQLVVRNGRTVSNLVFYPMIRKSTETDATFAPYENICPISGWTGCKVSATGKNLWDDSIAPTNIEAYSINGSKGTYKGRNLYLPKGTYTFSYNGTTITYIYGNVVNADGSWASSFRLTKPDSLTPTFTLSDGQYAKLYIASGATTELTSGNIQLELGSTATPYEPYTGRTIPINWQTEAGTVYGGKLDVLSGMLTVEMAMLDMMSLVWTYNNTSYAYGFFSGTVPNKKVGSSNLVCSQYKTIHGGRNMLTSNATICPYNTTNSNSVCVRDDAYIDATAFKTAMSGVQLVYELAEPIEVQLTPHEVRSLLGHNTIYANTGNTTVEYCADTEMYIEKVKPIVNVDDVQINGTSIVNDGVANVPLASPDNYGVVKIGNGVTIVNVGTNKLLSVNRATDAQVKDGTQIYRPITPVVQDSSTFYGLAKAAGADEKDSTLAFGTYSDNAKSSIQNMLGITDKYSPKDWIAESETELVTNAHSVGDLFYIGETLYKVIADLNAGDAINVGVNVEEVNANDILDDYATKEDVQDNVSIVEKSASGSIASFTDGADDIPLKSLVVDIDPVQSGTGDPSPDNVRPISGWTGANIQRTGVNVFDGVFERGTFNNNGTPANSTTRLRTGFIRVQQDYIFITVPTANVVINEIYRYDANKQYVSKKAPSSASNVVEIGSNVKYIRFSVRYSDNSTITLDDGVQALVKFGRDSTDFEPYTGRTIPISWQTEAGTVYGGKLDVLSGVLRVERKCIDLSNVEFIRDSAGYFQSRANATIINDAKHYASGEVANLISSQYVAKAVASVKNNNGSCGMYWYATDNRNILRIRDDRYSDAQSFMSAMVGVQLCYELAEPITIQLTLHEVSSILGTNNIFADTGNTSVEYFSQVDKDLIDYIETSLKPYAKEEKLNDYVSDVQVNGTSIVNDGVANVPIASLTSLGLMKVGSGLMVSSSGIVKILPSDNDLNKIGTDINRPITPSTQHSSTFYGLTKAAGVDMSSSSNAVGIYTEDAKTAIKTMLGVHDTYDSFIEEVTGTDVTITGQPSYRYNCGEVLSLSITPPSNGTIDIRFTSGSTPTVLTLPSTVKMPEWWVEVEANTIYEMCITDGIYCGVMTWAI